MRSVSPILTTPVPGATVGTVIAAYGLGWQQSSLGLWPILWGVALSKESVVGGTSVVGTVTLLNPAPPGGVEVALVNNDSDLITLPQTILIPEGATGATFNVVTAPVSVPTRVTIDSGTAFEGYHAPSTWLTLLPAGSPTPPPSLSALTLASAKILGERTTTGTVTLTAPAPAGGAIVRLSGSMEGQVVTPGECDRAGGQHQRQLHDHGAPGECAALRPHPGDVRDHRRNAGEAAGSRSGAAGRPHSPRIRRRPDGSHRRRLDARDRRAGHAGAGRRRCGDADERQSVGRPGTVHRVHCRGEQREQLHDQHEPRQRRDDGARSTPRRAASRDPHSSIWGRTRTRRLSSPR